MPDAHTVAVPAWARKSRTWLVAGVGVLLAVAAAAWLWPGLVRDSGRTDVLLVGSGVVSDQHDAIERQLREKGRRVEVIPAGALCDGAQGVARAVTQSSPAIVVLSPLGNECQGDAVASLQDAIAASHGARVVLLVQPGPPPVGQSADVRTAIAGDESRRNVLVADPSTLLAEARGSPARLPCQWWDDCEADGFVTVRDAAGALTPAGGQRIARVLAGAMP
jgi:hypothetical protein